MSALLESNKLDPKKDVRWLTVRSGADRFRTLVIGRLDASVVAIGDSIMLKKYPNLKVLAYNLPSYLFNVIATFDDFLEKNQAQVLAVTRGLVKATRDLMADKELYLKAVSKGMQLDYSKEDLANLWKTLVEVRHFGPNGGMSEKRAQATIDFYYRYINPDAKRANVQEVYAWSPIKQALKEIGIVNASWDPVDY